MSSLICAVCSVQCAVCYVQCAVCLCSVQCAECYVKWAVCSVQCAICSGQCEVCNNIMGSIRFSTGYDSVPNIGWRILAEQKFSQLLGNHLKSHYEILGA